MATPPRRRGRLALQLASAASLPGPPVADHHVLGARNAGSERVQQRRALCEAARLSTLLRPTAHAEGGDARPALLLPWPLPAPLGGPWAADAPQVPLRSGEAPAQVMRAGACVWSSLIPLRLVR